MEISNRNAFTPAFVSNKLRDVAHTFLYVLECETRQHDPKTLGENGPKQKYTPPRFCVIRRNYPNQDGVTQNQDPCLVPITDLTGVTMANPLQVPNGWEKIHQYIYNLQSNTDEHGWQYRSDWSNGALTALDEQWVPDNRDGLDVRRRLWFLTLCLKDDVTNAKEVLEKAIRFCPRGVIMRGDLVRLEQGTLMKSWVNRHVMLKDDRLEFYQNEQMNKRLGEYNIKGCACKMLFGSQCPEKPYAFSVRSSDSSVAILLDGGIRETRRRWVVAISYQLAILYPSLNFPAFDYGPPTGDDALDRVLTCGELAKQGHVVKNWKKRFFKLTPVSLQYYEKETLKGQISIVDARLQYEDDRLEFTVTSKDGHVLVMRADTVKTRDHWVNAVKEQLREQQDRLRATIGGAESPSAKKVEEVAKEVETHWREETAVTHSNEEVALGAGVATIEEDETEGADAEEEVDEYVSAPEPSAPEPSAPEPQHEPAPSPASEPAAALAAQLDEAALGEDSYRDEEPRASLTEEDSGQRRPYQERRESLKNVDSPYKRSSLAAEVLTPEEEERRRTVAENIAKYEQKIKAASEEVEAKPWLGKRGSVLSPDKK